MGSAAAGCDNIAVVVRVDSAGRSEINTGWPYGPWAVLKAEAIVWLYPLGEAVDWQAANIADREAGGETSIIHRGTEGANLDRVWGRQHRI